MRIAWIFFLAAPTALLSQDTIAPERPSITNSPDAVSSGSFQIENGFQVSHSQGERTFDAPETFVRFGVGGGMELRFTAPNYLHGPGSGFGDVTLGVKRELGRAPGGFETAVILQMSLPGGADAVSSHGYDPGLQLPWSHKVSDHWTAGGMFSLYWPTQAGARNLTGESTFLLDWQVTKPCDAFIEYAADIPRHGGTQSLLHFGAAYKLSPRQEVDLHFGVGLSAAAVDHFIGIGYSLRFH